MALNFVFAFVTKYLVQLHLQSALLVIVLLLFDIPVTVLKTDKPENHADALPDFKMFLLLWGSLLSLSSTLVAPISKYIITYL